MSALCEWIREKLFAWPRAQHAVVIPSCHSRASDYSTRDGASGENNDDEKSFCSDVSSALGSYSSGRISPTLSLDFEMLGDKESVLSTIDDHGGLVLQHVAEALRNDKEVVLAAVTKNGNALEFASPFLKGDKDVVLASISEDYASMNTLNFASEAIRADKEFMSDIVAQYNGNALQYASEELQNDKDLVLEAVEEQGAALQFASEGMKADKDVVLAAVKQRGDAIMYASNELRGNKEILTAALNTHNGEILSYASEDIRDDKLFVLDVVSTYGIALEYASERLRADKDVVLAAVASWGAALQFASENLRASKGMALAAVENAGALQFVADDLKSDKEVVLKAVSTDPESLKFALGGLNQDHDCWIAAGLWSENQEQTKQKPDATKVALSTKFSLSSASTSSVNGFTNELSKHPYFRDRNFDIYSPNFFCKTTCDPNWTRMDWPCRGTYETCEMDAPYKVGKPRSACCWRYSFRWHLEEAKRTNGFMIQIVDMEKNQRQSNDGMMSLKYTLGDGQKIETVMANDVGTKIFRVYRPHDAIFGDDQYALDFQPRHIDALVSKIEAWYEGGATDMEECEILNENNDE